MEKYHKIEFKRIYLAYYPKLVRFSEKYLLSREDAENVVQDAFLYLWEENKTAEGIENLNAYLFALVKNRSIDLLRKKQTVDKNKLHIEEYQLQEYRLILQAMESFDDTLLADDINTIINAALDRLPQRCREIFVLSKIEGLKYAEISKKLDLSTHTVRNQMAIALKKMKEELKDHPALLYLLLVLL